MIVTFREKKIPYTTYADLFGCYTYVVHIAFTSHFVESSGKIYIDNHEKREWNNIKWKIIFLFLNFELLVLFVCSSTILQWYSFKWMPCAWEESKIKIIFGVYFLKHFQSRRLFFFYIFYSLYFLMWFVHARFFDSILFEINPIHCVLFLWIISRSSLCFFNVIEIWWNRYCIDA